jgi:hypothetical protein
MKVAPNKMPVIPATEVQSPFSPTTGPKNANAKVNG